MIEWFHDSWLNGENEKCKPCDDHLYFERKKSPLHAMVDIEEVMSFMLLTKVNEKLGLSLFDFMNNMDTRTFLKIKSVMERYAKKENETGESKLKEFEGI